VSKRRKNNKTRAILTTNYGREENERCYGGTRTKSAKTAQKVWSCPTHLHQKGEWASPFSHHESGLATAHLDELHSSRRQEGGYTPSWPLCTPFPKRAQCGHWFLLLKRITSAGMHSLLQTATSDSLEAQPEGESVTMLPPTSDHSVKVFTPTLFVSHQRLTLFRQKQPTI
jgi:hypothetical protein